ncbi:DUF4215 domain-containing protein [Haliangium ochraceum]|nr:DUF4215 domain-containing protein [Haliangium ochraceum]
MLAVLAGCGGSETIHCDDGQVCPAGMRCAAEAKVCFVGECGDGEVDLARGEMCDDGNFTDGDGCTSDCRSNEDCGNGELDDHLASPEVCDDGNTVSGDDCSADCMSRETCGNGIVDTTVGEVCDGGNTESGDGCSDDCKSDESCGNGIVDVGEECDDGDTESGDGDSYGCSDSCLLEDCGDGIQQPWEDCDDGNREDNDDCSRLCRLEFCGDGVQQSGEECDDGNLDDNDGCNGACITEFCGDGIPQSDEQCDDGNDDDEDNCRECRRVFCGNAYVDEGETCDDGNRDSGDGCSEICTVEEGCGDGVIQQGRDPDGNLINLEECDDWNTFSGDGCSAECRDEWCGNNRLDRFWGEVCEYDANVAPPECSADCKTSYVCGDGEVQSWEVCDDGNAREFQEDESGQLVLVNGLPVLDDCSADCLIDRTLDGSGCGDGFRDLAAGEVCDDGNTCDYQLVDGACPLEGADEDLDNCSADCSESRICGNGRLDRWIGEVCDDGNRVSGDGCSADCLSTEDVCGNGYLDGDPDSGTGEACDDGYHTSRCTPDCQLPTCGDGYFHGGTLNDATEEDETDFEQCDDGGDSADCDADCTLRVCGDGYTNPVSEYCDVDEDGDGVADNVVDCDRDCSVPACNDGVWNPAFEYCDLSARNTNDEPVWASDACDVDCTEPACGDGVYNPAFAVESTESVTLLEQCDDGNRLPGDGCSALCQREVCGNGLVDVLAGEVCDDGNRVGGDGCSADCRRSTVCGDDNRQDWEVCDDGNTSDYQVDENGEIMLDDDGLPIPDECSANCLAARDENACGDGYRDLAAGEVCDDGNTSDCELDDLGVCRVDESGEEIPDACSANCRDNHSCDNGQVEPWLGEVCDDGNTDDGDGCSAECASEQYCGNGFVDRWTDEDEAVLGEDCEPGIIGSARCNSDCTFSECGDSIVNPSAGEQCDDGAAGSATCTPACTVNQCGDLHVGGDEACDDGNFSNADDCVNGCALAFCGDGYIRSAPGNEENPETCDAYGEDTLFCDRDCTAPQCRDGVWNEIVEECDPSALDEGGEPVFTDAECDNDCSFPACNDGEWNQAAGEYCDLSALNDETGEPLFDAGECDSDCTEPECGDGMHNPSHAFAGTDDEPVFEQCDDGNSYDDDACVDGCITAVCGDGHVRLGEERCDDGEENSDEPGAYCNTLCQLAFDCGNGVVDSLEECDDGNRRSGDGCSAQCRNEICGNEVVDFLAGEVCDDGNNDSGDGCSADCRRSTVCGDGNRQDWEVCDDGNTSDYVVDENGVSTPDACSANCLAARDDDACGDGYRDLAAGEVCDDGNACDHGREEDGTCRENGPRDDCSADCQNNRLCGNGSIETWLGEGCDDHNEEAGDGCRADCVAEEYCGNGLLDILTDADGNEFVEDCEPGVIGSARCNSDCTFSECGDGIVNPSAGEQCDPGQTSSVECTSECRLNYCGDGEPLGDEACDDGNFSNADDCVNGCALAFCGDGYIRSVSDNQGNLETCDAYGEDTLFCDRDCTVPACNDDVWNEIVEECDPSARDENGARVFTDGECDSDCSLPACGDGVWNQAAGEYCDLTALDANGEPLFEAGACDIDCTEPACGDGVHNPAYAFEGSEDAPLFEECDDGNDDDDDACVDGCFAARCGDGDVHLGVEQCDEGEGNSNEPGAYCNILCQVVFDCGNGVVDLSEECDDGNRHSGDGCSAQCRYEVCGNDIVDVLAGEVCDDGNNNSGDGCSADCRRSTVCGDGNRQDWEVCDDGNTSDYVVDENGVSTPDACSANCLAARDDDACGDGYRDLAAGEVCDDGNACDHGREEDGTCRENGPRDDCSANCQDSRLCGNGNIETWFGEGCDDHNEEAGDGCRADCVAEEYCGNGLLDILTDADGNEFVEQCEPGVIGSARCNNDCTLSECGDGIVNPSAGEQCDPGQSSSVVCTSECRLNYCGDGEPLGDEQCDDGNFSNADDCVNGCVEASCGDGFVRVGVEECDDGSAGSATCSPDCTSIPVTEPDPDPDPDPASASLRASVHTLRGASVR